MASGRGRRACVPIGYHAAAIAVNASTRFTDGSWVWARWVSRRRLHARGPISLAELTTATWIYEGEGTIRP